MMPVPGGMMQVQWYDASSTGYDTRCPRGMMPVPRGMMPVPRGMMQVQGYDASSRGMILGPRGMISGHWGQFWLRSIFG